MHRFILLKFLHYFGRDEADDTQDYHQGLHMNQKNRPVSLARIIQVTRFAEMTRACSGDELAEFLRISGKRAEEIAGEAVKIGLLEKDGSRYCETPACSVFLQCVQEHR